MDDPLKRRLVGVCALLLLALLISFVLPSPGGPGPDADGLKHVTLDLSRPPGAAAPAATQPSSPMPPVIAAAPAPADADGTAAEDDDAPQFDTPAVQQPVADSQGVPAQQAQAPAPQNPPRAAATKPEPPAVSGTARPEPPAAPQAAQPAAVKPGPPKAAPTAPASSQTQQGHWFIQAGVFSDIDNARRLAGRLKSGGYATVISPAETHAGVAYRVKAGPYASQAQAQAAQQGLPRLGIAHSILLNP
jgi:DedD protein